MEQESPEEFFMKYSFPCAHVLLQTGTITQEQHDELGISFLKKEFPSKQEIEKYFTSAFRRIKMLAKEMNIQDYWDIRVLKEYWHNYHNKMIEQGEGNYSKFPESFCDFCKTHIAEVVQILPENFILIKYNNTQRPVSKDYVQDVKIGDKVRIHHAYAIEILE
jgi:hypothetical protein